MSPGGTRKPVTPSAITSLSAPRLNATTGVPQACASAAAMPNGSSHADGHKTTAARAIAAHNDARGTARWTATPGWAWRGPICSRA